MGIGASVPTPRVLFTRVGKTADTEVTEESSDNQTLSSTRSNSFSDDAKIELNFEQLKLQNVIGRGSFGEVHSATLLTSNFETMEVAAKVFDPDPLRPNIPLIQRLDQLKVSESTFNSKVFLRESQILNQVEHPHIVGFFGCVVRSPFHAIVMERCEGSAAEIREVGKRLKVEVNWERTLHLLRGTAEACRYLHERNPCILHRDVKGENILISSDFECRLTDFGFSRFKENGIAKSMTLCGTPYWLAPEVFRKERYTEKIDVYSFGLVIWEVCYRKKPFHNISVLQLSYAVGVIGKRPDVDDNLPQLMHKLLKSCWAQDPLERPTFGTVVEEIDRVLSSSSPFLQERLQPF